jgi:hypothetical protein
MTEESNRQVLVYLSVLSFAFVGIAIFILGTYYFFQQQKVTGINLYSAEAAVEPGSEIEYKEEDGYILTSKKAVKVPFGFSIDAKYAEQSPGGFNCVYTDNGCAVYEIVSEKGIRFYVGSNAPIYLDIDTELPQVPTQLGKYNFSRSILDNTAMTIRGCYDEDLCLHSGTLMDSQNDTSENLEEMNQFLQNIDVIDL